MYVADSGILHALLGLSTREAILSHPEVGASWEGFVVQQIIQLLAASAEQCFHWSTHAGAQLDLLVVAGNRRYGFEVKRAEAPRTTPRCVRRWRRWVSIAWTWCTPTVGATRWPRGSEPCPPPVSRRCCGRWGE